MSRHRYFFVLALVLLLLAGVVGWRLWQGPAVNVVYPERSLLIQNVVAAGRVISTSRAQIGVEMTGTVAQRHVQEGDQVRTGDLLLTLHSDEPAARLAEAQAALENLRTSRRPQALAVLEQNEFELAQAQREAQRRRELIKTRSIATELYEKSAQAEVVAKAKAQQARIVAEALAPGATEERILIERVKAAQAALDKTQVRAQVNGLILSREIEPGDQVQPGRVLFEIARDGHAEVLVPVDERNLGILELGQPAICIADAFPEQPFEARINFIAPTIDRQRGTIDLRLEIPQAPDFLKEDMTVTATITTAEVPDALLIPNNALRHMTGDTATVMILQNGEVTEKQIIVGLRGLVKTQVLKGLSSSDQVITSAQVVVGQSARANHVD